MRKVYGNTPKVREMMIMDFSSVRNQENMLVATANKYSYWLVHCHPTMMYIMFDRSYLKGLVKFKGLQYPTTRTYPATQDLPLVYSSPVFIQAPGEKGIAGFIYEGVFEFVFVGHVPRYKIAATKLNEETEKRAYPPAYDISG
ncbi:hypothetical protein AgCh_017478 [Apium graveolens]